MMARLDNATVQAAFQAALDNAIHDETGHVTPPESRARGSNLGQDDRLGYLRLCQSNDLLLFPRTEFYQNEAQQDSTASVSSSDFDNQWLRELPHSCQVANAGHGSGLMGSWTTVGQAMYTSQFPMIPPMNSTFCDDAGSQFAVTELTTAPHDPTWTSGVNAQAYTEQQTGSSGVEISVLSETPKAIEFVMHEPMPSQEQAMRGAMTTKTKRKKHSDKHWEMLRRNYLCRLYIQESHTMDELIFEMFVIHGHKLGKPTLEKKFKLWGFSKNRSQGQVSQGSVAQRRRTAWVLPATSSTIKDLRFASMNEERRKLDRQRPHFRLATAYLHQEKMFHALDHLVKSLFASGSRSWTSINPRSTIFKPPDLAFEKASLDWQMVFDKCRCIAILSDVAQYGEALSVLEDTVESLRSAAQLCSPSFFVYFWKISLTLIGVRLGDRKSFSLLRSFLLYLQVILSSSVGEHHPMTNFVVSLAAVTTSTPLDLKITLGLACWKAIHVIAGMLGQDHAIVLNLTAHCVTNWKSRFNPREEAIESSYRRLGASNSVSADEISQDDISFHFDHLLATCKRRNNTTLVIRQAIGIWTMTKDSCCKKPQIGVAYDSLALQAFVSTTEMLASHYIDVQGPDRLSSLEIGYEYLSKGIDTLANGSKEHQIHAMSLSRRLENYLKASHDRQRAMKERERGTEIRLRIKKMLTTSSWISHQEPGDRPKTGGAWAKKNRQTRRESRQRLTLLLDNKELESM